MFLNVLYILRRKLNTANSADIKKHNLFFSKIATFNFDLQAEVKYHTPQVKI